jgi:hypothetical protein
MIGYCCAIMLSLLDIMAAMNLSTNYIEEDSMWLKLVEYDE